jgi:hypothetical protein
MVEQSSDAEGRETRELPDLEADEATRCNKTLTGALSSKKCEIVLASPTAWEVHRFGSR